MAIVDGDLATHQRNLPDKPLLVEGAVRMCRQLSGILLCIALQERLEWLEGRFAKRQAGNLVTVHDFPDSK